MHPAALMKPIECTQELGGPPLHDSLLEPARAVMVRGVLFEQGPEVAAGRVRECDVVVCRTQEGSNQPWYGGSVVVERAAKDAQLSLR